MAIDNAFAKQSIQEHFGSDLLGHEEPFGLLTIEINPEKLIDIVGWLYNHPELKMTYLTDLCAVHYPEQSGREIAVVYHLHSLPNNLRVRLKAFLPVAGGHIASLTGIFSGANWMERETFDFYGVQFDGHPQLKRILNMDEMDYHPLLKQYALEDETREDKDDRFFGR
ncbi:MAG: NADH-quinone oxidoreductase subunit C [Bacteroidetes bacterium]|nr:NADH-quinone oxidoreductase subunit C [Bacteroidota bacterium]